MPAAQSTHVPAADAPIAPDHLPAAHCWHVSAVVALATVEYLPRPQDTHPTDPGESLYFPIAHWVQMPPSAPEDPALQVHSVLDELPCGEFESGRHASHVVCSDEAWY